MGAAPTECGFKILPKLFDANYRPGSVGDEGDRIITKAQVCVLEEIMDKDVHILMWLGFVLQLPEMREELRRGAEGGVLDMSFEKEVIEDIESVRGRGKGDYLNDTYLYQDNEALERLCKILTILSDCMDEVKRTFCQASNSIYQAQRGYKGTPAYCSPNDPLIDIH